jgi:surfactin synthase thioesterase subunit
VRPKPARVATPLLVLGADNDNAVVNGDVRATVRAYRVQAEFFPGGHNMMLEPGWPDVAERIHSWLTSQGI